MNGPGDSPKEPAETQPVFVLSRPQLGGNIGAAARAMLNFGLDRLRIVDPRDGWPSEEAVAMASGAGRVIDGAELFPTDADALSDCSFVFATTARRREANLPVVPPSEAAAEARARAEAGQRVGFLFGPERAGLENVELARAGAIISVPSNPEFSSLNLAQCVLLIAYEWKLARFDRARFDLRHERLPPSRLEAKEVLANRLERDLEQAGYFWPESKSDGMKLNLRSLIMRLELSDPEVRTLHGVRKALKRMESGGGSRQSEHEAAAGGVAE